MENIQIHTDPDTIIRFEGITKQFGSFVAVDHLNLEIKRGEIMGFLGPNGAGKSTILKVISGMVKSFSGNIFWYDKKIIPLPHRMTSAGISYIPQEQKNFSNLTVKENLEIGGLYIKDARILKDRIRETTIFFPDLGKKINVLAKNISGGQQQMLALARALIANPKLLMLDEPLTGLSPKIAKEILQKIKEINHKKGTTVLIVEHNIKSALDISSRIYFLRQGKILFENDAKNIKTEKLLRNLL